MCLSLSVSNIPFCGSDVGGFTGYASPRLITRWYEHGVFQVFFRAHGHESVEGRDPWAQGEFYPLIREYVHLRHSLLPYIYTQFQITTLTGIPIMRPMYFAYP